jgi:ribosomal protein S18 acetylase RimI-like enzyme
MSDYRIRAMTRDELDLGIDWAAAEGWNPGLHDADSFHATAPGGFFVGLLDGQPIGMISAVPYGRDFGFVGFYLVKPEFRGRGHGLALWQVAMQSLAGRRVGLDGVVAQQDNYRRSGFQWAWNNERYEGVPRRAARPDAAIVPLRQLPMEPLLRYDAAFFPAGRETFLRHWIAQRGSTALGLQEQGTLVGYGVIRPCGVGFKVGPLFADSLELADRLLRALVAHTPDGSRVQLDVPAIHAAALALTGAHGMQPVFQTARMYTGVAPAIDIGRLYGITSFELG